jgi:hypothetical protein
LGARAFSVPETAALGTTARHRRLPICAGRKNLTTLLPPDGDELLLVRPALVAELVRVDRKVAVEAICWIQLSLALLA